MTTPLDLQLPEGATLIGRAWRPGLGASVVTVRQGRLFDLTASLPTLAVVLAAADPAAAVQGAAGEDLGELDAALAASRWDRRREDALHLLAPADLQPIKAAGVTFVQSLLERVIEEQADGDPTKAAAVREQIEATIGTDLKAIRPGSDTAQALKAELQGRGLWSQYLEVGIGPDAEIFTKAPPMSAVGTGAMIGLHPVSRWNNPEPEMVLAIGPDGGIKGATLGNDVNLRDVEGRSALLLGRAKDNNGACALGPFVRLFDGGFALDDVRATTVDLRVEGDDGFVLNGSSSMQAISRDPADLAAQTLNDCHQYPDGVFLMCGTMFAPTQDRGEAGSGFTHHDGDVVTIAAPAIGRLVNRIGRSDRIPRWTYGLTALFRDLGRRGLA